MNSLSYINAAFLEGNKNYTLRAKATSINSEPLQNLIADEFVLRTVE